MGTKKTLILLLFLTVFLIFGVVNAQEQNNSLPALANEEVNQEEASPADIYSELMRNITDSYINNKSILSNENQEVFNSLMSAPTGNMNDQIWIEITARLACKIETKQEYTESEFDEIKKTFDVTAEEYVAYHWQLITMRFDSMDFEDLFQKLENRTKELEADDCKFDTDSFEVSDSTSSISKCEDTDGDDYYKKGKVLLYNRTATTGDSSYWCNPCAYSDECAEQNVLEKYCFYDENDCSHGCVREKSFECPYGCYNGKCLEKEEASVNLCYGICTDKECPFGSVSIGKEGCPIKEENCSKDASGEEKCEIKEHCCLPLGETSAEPEQNACQGSCVSDISCPEGQENQGIDGCPLSEECYKCGFLNLFTCCAYTPRLCCVGVSSQPTEPQTCNGMCTAELNCPPGWESTGRSGCALQKKCEKCGFLGLKKCCEYVSTNCCIPKTTPAVCSGICTIHDCPAGTEDVGASNCGVQKKCHRCGFLGLKKCCDKIQKKCCDPQNPVSSCEAGTCTIENCPEGTENCGGADCGVQKKCHRCGFLGLFKCCENFPASCCMPKSN